MSSCQNIVPHACETRSPRVLSYLIDLHDDKQIITLQVDFVSRTYRSCDGVDDFVSLELLVVPY